MRNPKDVIRSHPAGIVLIVCILTGLAGIHVDTRSDDRTISFSVGLDLLQNMFSGIGNFFTDTINSIQELKNLQEEYEDLQNKLKSMELSAKETESLEMENQRLRRLLDFGKTLSFSFIAAEIIAMDPGALFNGMTINKGSHDGVRRDMPVIAFQDGQQALIGKIVDLSDKTSKILPVFDNNSFVAVRFEKSRYEGLINGKGEKYGSLVARYVNKQAVGEITYGDLVLTSGLRSIYPPDIPVGVVREIESPEWQASLIITVAPVIDFSRVQYVYILREEVPNANQ